MGTDGDVDKDRVEDGVGDSGDSGDGDEDNGNATVMSIFEIQRRGEQTHHVGY